MVLMVTLSKVLGLLWIVPLSRLIHEDGIGYYSQAYSLYVFVLTLSTAGFPTAMGKLVAERLALRRYAEVEQLYRTTLRTVMLLGVLLFLLTWFGAPLYSALTAIRETHQAQSAVTLSIRALAPAMLVIPVLSTLRGYLNGFQILEPSGYSQAVEQLVRVATIVLGAYGVIKAGGTIAEGAAAATFGAVTGAVAGVILLIFAVVPLRRRFRPQVQRQRSQLTPRQALRLLASYALPVCLGSLVVPISGLVDSLTITNFLMWAGDSYQVANAQYGIFSRQAMQLIQLPLAFAMALGVSVLPAIAEASAKRDEGAVEARIRDAFRSMLFMTLPVAAALLVLGRPLDQLLAGDTKGAVIVSSVCFMGIFSSLETLSTYLLQGLGKMYRPVRNMFLGVCVKIVMNLVLILPFHILGAAVATSVGYLVSTTLNVLAVKKYAHSRVSVWRLSAPLMVASVLCAVGLFLGNRLGMAVAHGIPSADVQALFQVVLGVAFGGVLYVTAAIRMRAVTPSELQRIPMIGRRLSPWAARLQRRTPATGARR